MGALENDLNPDVWIGLSLPLGQSDSGFFEQTQTTLKQTSSNIRNLLLTMKGERPFLPEFGCDIYSALFEPIGDDTSAYKDFDAYMTRLDPVGGYLTGKFGKEKAESLVNEFLFEYGS